MEHGVFESPECETPAGTPDTISAAMAYAAAIVTHTKQPLAVLDEI